MVALVLCSFQKSNGFVEMSFEFTHLLQGRDLLLWLHLSSKVDLEHSPCNMASIGFFDKNGLEASASTVGPNGVNGLYFQTYNLA